jgi:hypothetical protein
VGAFLRVGRFPVRGQRTAEANIPRSGAGQLLDEGDLAWHRILNAIERLQAKAPAEGEKVHLAGAGATKGYLRGAQARSVPVPVAV